jgi:hypothetical protein
VTLSIFRRRRDTFGRQFHGLHLSRLCIEEDENGLPIPNFRKVSGDHGGVRVTVLVHDDSVLILLRSKLARNASAFVLKLKAKRTAHVQAGAVIGLQGFARQQVLRLRRVIEHLKVGPEASL